MPPLDRCNPKYIYNPDNIEKVLLDIPLSRSRLLGGGSEGGSIVSGYEGERTSSGSFQAHGSGGYSSGGGAGYDRSGKITQIKPQRLQLQLRASKFDLFNVFFG